MRTRGSSRLFPVLATAALIASCGGEPPADDTVAQSEDASAAEVTTVAGGLLNPNLAVRDELSRISELNDAALDAIGEGRPFLSMAALHAAISPHVAAESIESLYGKLWVPIDLNSASSEEILLIPGVGERMEHEFEEYRPYEAMGRFHREMAKYVDDAEVNRLAQYVFVQIDLNTATAEEILAIPGVGERMQHEFEEYRPYENMEQFRREMAKYVDEGEVARLERYVTIR